MLIDLGLGYLTPESPHTDGVTRRTAAPAAGHPAARRACSACSTCSTSRRRDCTPPTPNRCSTCSIGFGAAGNSLFVVEHDMDVVRRADWIVDVGPGAGELGGDVLYSGPVPGLADIEGSVTRQVPVRRGQAAAPVNRRTQSGRLRLRGICFHNLRDLDVDLPLGVYTAVTGVSGSGKSTLVVKVLGDVVNSHLGTGRGSRAGRIRRRRADAGIVDLDHDASVGVTAEGVEEINRLVSVDQRPIGRTPRSTLATYTGLFDAVRRRSPRPRRRVAAVGQRAGFRSTWPTVAAPPVRARGSSRSNCCSCQAHTPHARRATERVTPTRHSRCAIATARSPTCSR